MVFQEFDKKKKDLAKDLRDRKKETQSSSAVWHAQYTVNEDRKLANVHERGQEQKELKKDSVFPQVKEQGKENDKESQMKEVFHTENAFARLSLGLNEKGESVFVASRKLHADIKSTERSERELDEQRSYNWHVMRGDDKVNFHKPGESAYGFYQVGHGKTEPHTRAQRILSNAQEFASLTGNRMTEEFIPSKPFKVGETKGVTSREMILQHQMSIAIERGKKKLEENKDKGIIPNFYKKEDELAPKKTPDNENNPFSEDPWEDTAYSEDSWQDASYSRSYGGTGWLFGGAMGSTSSWVSRGAGGALASKPTGRKKGRKKSGMLQRKVRLHRSQRKPQISLTEELMPEELAAAAGLEPEEFAAMPWLWPSTGIMGARQARIKELGFWWPGLLLIPVLAAKKEEEEEKKKKADDKPEDNPNNKPNKKSNKKPDKKPDDK